MKTPKSDPNSIARSALSAMTEAELELAAAGEVNWFFEGAIDARHSSMRTEPLSFPCKIGRGAAADLTLPFPSVSGIHAEMYLEDGTVFLRDLGSTNGTFLNREPVTDTVAVNNGDVLHFGEHEMRLVSRAQEMPLGTLQLDLSNLTLPNRLRVGADKMANLLSEKAVEPHFQPVVDLRDGAIKGYEVLGRGAYPGLPRAPYELLQLAEQVGLECELSVLFRDRGVKVGQDHAGAKTTFYVNTHPAEMLDTAGLFQSLENLRERHPEIPIVLEVHEGAVLQSGQLKALRKTLNSLGIQLSYDDFGAGRSRLAELLEFPPEVVKFDMVIVRDIDQAKPSKLKMVGSLVSMLLQEGVACLAEGVETEKEAAVCRDLGFDLAQGYLFGRPRPFGPR